MVKYTDIIDIDAPAITLEMAKKHLNIEEDFTDDDALIEQCIAAAQGDCVQYIARPLARTLVLECDNFDAVELAALPDASVTSVQFLAEGATEYADLPAENIKFRKKGTSIADLSFRGTDAHPLPALAVSNAAVRITVATACPAPLVQGMLLRIGNFYEKREDFGEIGYNSASRALWRPYKQY